MAKISLFDNIDSSYNVCSLNNKSLVEIQKVGFCEVTIAAFVYLGWKLRKTPVRLWSNESARRSGHSPRMRTPQLALLGQNLPHFSLHQALFSVSFPPVQYNVQDVARVFLQLKGHDLGLLLRNKKVCCGLAQGWRTCVISRPHG